MYECFFFGNESLGFFSPFFQVIVLSVDKTFKWPIILDLEDCFFENKLKTFLTQI